MNNNLSEKKDIEKYTDQNIGRISNRLNTAQITTAMAYNNIVMPVVETPNNTFLYDYTTNTNAITIKKAGKYESHHI